MPRVSDVYTLPPGTDAVTNTTISSTAYNTFIHDIELDQNTARPVIAGGTGSGNAAGARTNLGVPSIAGDTFTGNVVVTKVSPAIIVNKTAAAQDAVFVGQLNGVNRWQLAVGTSEAEGGSNAGSNFGIYRYNDAGAFQGAAFTIKRDTGNVGIGTASPGFAAGVVPNAKILTIVAASDRGMLELANTAGDTDNAPLGHVSFCAGGTQHAAIISQASGATAGNRGGNLSFYTKANGGAVAQRMIIDNVGAVGINTASPSGAKLDVDGNIKARASGNILGTPGGNAGAPTQATTNAVLYDLGAANWSGIGCDTNGHMYFVTGVSVPATRMVIKNDGNVGIGTTGPGYKLEIVGTFGITGAMTINGAVTVLSGNQLWAQNTVSYFGIGGTGSFQAGLVIDGGSGANGGSLIAFRKNGANTWWLGHYSTLIGGGSVANDLIFHNASYGTQLQLRPDGSCLFPNLAAATAPTNGAVVFGGGIGCNAYSHFSGLTSTKFADPGRFHDTNTAANGSVCLTLQSNGAANTYFVNMVDAVATQRGLIYHNGSAMVYATNSDERLKPHRELIDLDYARDIIDRLEIYDYDKPGNAIRGIGWTAQQARSVHKSFADAGRTPDDTWMSDRSMPMPFVIANVQQLNARLDAIERTMQDHGVI